MLSTPYPSAIPSPAQKVLSSCQPSKLPGSTNACSQWLLITVPLFLWRSWAAAAGWNITDSGAFCLFWGWWSTAWTALLHWWDAGTISLSSVCAAAFTTSCGWLGTTGWINKNYAWRWLWCSFHFQGKGTGQRDIKAANSLPAYQSLQGKAKEEQTSVWTFLTP